MEVLLFFEIWTLLFEKMIESRDFERKTLLIYLNFFPPRFFQILAVFYHSFPWPARDFAGLPASNPKQSHVLECPILLTIQVQCREFTDADIYGVELRYLVHHLQLMCNLPELLSSVLSFVTLNGVNQFGAILL